MYEAVYDYDGQAEGDLSFLAGNIIQVRLSVGRDSLARMHCSGTPLFLHPSSSYPSLALLHFF